MTTLRKTATLRYAYGLLAALVALTFFVTSESSSVEAQDAQPYLTNWEVLDEYGSLRIRPDFIASHPTQAQVVFVAPGIRKVKIKPHWEGSGITVNVATYDMSRNETIASDTITTSGTASSFLGIAPGGGTKLNISVTKGGQTTVYSKKALVRENSAANADNYLNSMGVSPNPNARVSGSSPGQGSSGDLDGFHHGLSVYVGLTAGGGGTQTRGGGGTQTRGGGGTQTRGSITLTPPFAPEVQEYSANVPYEVSSVIINPVPSHSKATATVNGNNPSTPVSLKVGRNVITVVVTAESGVQRTYTLTITRVVELPGPVTGLELTVTAENSVTVRWQAPEIGGAPDGYIVHLRPEGGKQGSGTTKTPKAKKTQVAFKNLESGRTYKVWVRAENEAGKGERVHASIDLPAVLPGPVTGLEVTVTAEDSVTVRWQAPEIGGAPDGYIVHLRPEGGKQGSGTTKTPKAKKTQVAFKNLESGRTYKVWVRAENEAGKGERVHASIDLPGPEPEQTAGTPGQ